LTRRQLEREAGTRPTPLNTKPMKRRYAVLLAGTLILFPSCQDFLDVNTNPNGPQSVSANLYLAPMLHWMVTSSQFDGRFVGLYTQEFVSVATTASPASTWGRMGYDPGSDNGAQQWRDVYWSFGQNLVDMNTKAEAEQRWDLLGVGLILKAWGWQSLTDLHGEIVIKEAFDVSRTRFDYDTQQYAYEEVQRLLTRAIELLQRTDGAVDQAYLAKTDKIYNGDRTKWLKFAYGLMAINLNHYSNKASYNPDSVIKLVDKSFASNADDALLTYPNTNNDDTNFLGRTRGNFFNYRQSVFIVSLMNGSQFGGVVDPRISRMLVLDSAGTAYTGLSVNTSSGFPAGAVGQRPMNPHGYPSTGGIGLPGKYLFDDRAKMPAMTYAQLQFIKAEAAYRSGNKVLALSAYTKAISAHIDFVNSRNSDASQQATQITGTEKAAFLAAPQIVPTLADSLTLTHIMSQKYIAQWAWGHNEMWMDMRRYHYFDVDPVSGRQVFPGFAQPTTLYVDNAGKVVQRIRPRYNSEYVWNRDALNVIGGLATAYHTDTLWITKTQP
jgi:hypothetical protein